MRLDRLSLRAYKNLRNFSIDFDESQFTTVLIGENGSGKSNLFEAIVRIFRSLDLNEPAPFAYSISYQCHGKSIDVQWDWLDSGRNRYVIRTRALRAPGEGEEVPWSRFYADREEYLPSYVFAYYSGPGERLRRLFDRHLGQWYESLLRGKQPERPLRRFFYCLPEHSRLVLLAYFIHGDFDRSFLTRYFSISDFDSAMVVLRPPRWKGKNRNERFWGAKGVVRTFLDRLWALALAPMRMEVAYKPDVRKQSVREPRVHLYVPDVGTLRKVGEDWDTPLRLFSALESVYTNDLLRDIQIRVTSGDESIPFVELSEGEQQLLTVVGLLRFTQAEESLFLLDEPDTHLNPRWKLTYLSMLREQAGTAANSHLLISTHDPLTIADLGRSQVHIFSRDPDESRRVRVEQPIEDPRGLGVTGVLTELFGLPTTLDPTTQGILDKREELASRAESLTEQEKETLRSLSRWLRHMGFADERRDPIEARFLAAMRQWQRERKRLLSETPAAEQRDVARRLLAMAIGDKDGAR